VFEDLESSILNQGQQAAADGFFQFLLNDQKELIISGPAGVGKTFLMGHLIDKVMPAYFQTSKLLGTPILYDEVEMTATTNKAAEVLSQAIKRPVKTIQSMLGLKVVDDYSTGTSRLQKTSRWTVHQRKIIFIEECSFIDGKLYNLIQEGTHGCKVVYVGDHCQIPPVTEAISPIYKANLPFFELTIPVRNAGQPELVKLCTQLRNTVETGHFHPVRMVPGVIDIYNDAQMETALAQEFAVQTAERRVLAYSNARVNMYNDHIRGIRNLPAHFVAGEKLINASAIEISGRILSVEDRVEILDVSDTPETYTLLDGTKLAVRFADFVVPFKGAYTNIPIPDDKDHFQQLIKYYSKVKDWRTYFQLKNTFPDFRPGDACTFHKSQGSTHDKVFIDADNLSTCRNGNDVARMLYVGVSRARTNIVFYGTLAEKYGGFV
jgi:exodeoxyribonuclease V